MSSNQLDGNLVSYAAGPLYYDAGLDTLVGGGAQYFNARTSSSGAPFDPAATDKLGVSINLNSDQVTFILESWGNTKKYVLYPSCRYGVLYGFVSPASIGLMTMSFLNL